MVPPNSPDVAIVGAGIIGLATAWHLLDRGKTVQLIDRDGMAMGASRGNAGAFAFSDILPLATSGVWRKLPGWLSDPLGPLSIRPSYLPQMAPWLLRFWRAGGPDRVAASLAAQGQLMGLARSAMAEMVAGAGLAHMVRHDGSLELYESEAEFTASLAGWQAREAAGIGFEHVRGSALAALQPGLAARFVAGTFVPAWQTVSDPYQFAVALGEQALARGATLLRQSVVAVQPIEGGAALALDDGSRLTARHVVIAAGAWSKTLTRALGDAVPLDTERGYNTTLPVGAFDVRRQLIFGGHGFVITPLASGLRIGGAVELGGLRLPPNFARSTAMLNKAALFLPGLRTGGGTQWMGFRPSMPDSLPVIGASRASPGIVYAFGHGHLGLTQSAATGRLVADLVSGAPPPIDPTPFSPRRFWRG